MLCKGQRAFNCAKIFLNLLAHTGALTLATGTCNRISYLPHPLAKQISLDTPQSGEKHAQKNCALYQWGHPMLSSHTRKLTTCIWVHLWLRFQTNSRIRLFMRSFFLFIFWLYWEVWVATYQFLPLFDSVIHLAENQDLCQVKFRNFDWSHGWMMVRTVSSSGLALNWSEGIPYIIGHSRTTMA